MRTQARARDFYDDFGLEAVRGCALGLLVTHDEASLGLGGPKTGSRVEEGLW